MTKMEIVEQLAKARRVEVIVQNTAHAHVLSQDLTDLCQMVYCYVLDYDEDKVVALHDADALDFFIARIVLNQFRSGNSLYHRLIRRPASRTLAPSDLPQIADPDTPHL